MAGATALGASALVTGVVGNGVRSVARNTLGNVALGEKNSLGKIGKDLALESLTGAIGGAGGTIVRGLTSTGTKAVVQGAVSAISTGARDVAENTFFGGNKSSTDIWANMGISFVTSAGISYLGDTLISKMNAAKANSGVQACKKAEVNYENQSKGSTGRMEPYNLLEKLSMEQVKSDPLNGATKLDKIRMTDSRWLAEDGWVKMQNVIKHSDGTSTNIHFVYNEITGAFDDFKFK